MHATEVMTRNVITVTPKTEVREIVELMLKNRISGVPVVDADQHVLGIVSEGDLMRRVENETDKRDSWWLTSLFAGKSDAEKYVKSHARRAEDIMSRKPITVSEETPLYQIAQTLEKHHIKRVPVTRDNKLVGIVTRANLLQGFSVSHAGESAAGSTDDWAIRENVVHELADEVGLPGGNFNVVVYEGVVHVWGQVETAAEKKAAQVAAESIPGVNGVNNHLGIVPPVIGPY